MSVIGVSIIAEINERRPSFISIVVEIAAGRKP
jgi:hypothetical protein